MGRLREASWILIAVGFGAVWGAAVLNRNETGAGSLFFLGLLVVLMGLVLTPRSTAIVAAVNLAGVVAFPFAFRDVALADITSPFVFLAIVSTLVLVEAAIRHRTLRQVEAQSRTLTESEERYRTLFDASFEGLAIDEDGLIVDANPRLAPMFGYTGIDLRGRRLEDLLDAASHAPVVEAGFGQLREAAGRRGDGTGFPIAVVSRACTFRGRPARVTAWRDLTEEKRAEEELESSRRRMAMSEKLSALGTLVAGVGHEINNPLAFMRGTVELHGEMLRGILARPDLPADLRAEVQDIAENEETVLRGIARIEHITTSLKQVARAGDGVRRSEDVGALVESVLTVAAPRLRDGITVVREFGASRPVVANGAELSQVVLNLVFNAADAVRGRPGGLVIVRTLDVGDSVALEVEDNGGGIPEEQAGKIFTPFHTTKPQGTGLGLSTSWRIVESHAGRFSFESAPGRTVFRVELPATVSAGRTQPAA